MYQNVWGNERSRQIVIRIQKKKNVYFFRKPPMLEIVIFFWLSTLVRGCQER